MISAPNSVDHGVERRIHGTQCAPQVVVMRQLLDKNFGRWFYRRRSRRIRVPLYY